MESHYSSDKVKKLSLVEAVRKRPGMYFGDVDDGGANNAINELIANAIDQFLAGLCDMISVKIKNGRIFVCDNGSGLPFHKKAPNNENLSLVEYYLTHRHDAPTADNHAPHIHIAHGGLGLVVVNAASAKLLIESADGNYFWEQAFGKGKIMTKATCVKGHYPKGTQIEVVLDPDIFGDNALDMFKLRKTMFELAHFFPGLTVELENERFFSKNGLLDLASILYKRPSKFQAQPRRFFFSGKQDDIQIQVAAIGQSDSGTEYISWVNGIETVEGGTHVKGLHHALTTAQWCPEIALVYIIMHNPKFAGPCVDKLCSTNVAQVIKALLVEPLSLFVKQKNDMIQFFK